MTYYHHKTTLETPERFLKGMHPKQLQTVLNLIHSFVGSSNNSVRVVRRKVLEGYRIYLEEAASKENPYVQPSTAFLVRPRGGFKEVPFTIKSIHKRR